MLQLVIVFSLIKTVRVVQVPCLIFSNFVHLEKSPHLLKPEGQKRRPRSEGAAGDACWVQVKRSTEEEEEQRHSGSCHWNMSRINSQFCVNNMENVSMEDPVFSFMSPNRRTGEVLLP